MSRIFPALIRLFQNNKKKSNSNSTWHKTKKFNFKFVNIFLPKKNRSCIVNLMASRQRNENGAISQLLLLARIIFFHCRRHPLCDSVSTKKQRQKPQNIVYIFFVTKKQRPEQEQGCMQRWEICFFFTSNKNCVIDADRWRI
jgi:hypothetical protein